jgi:hypothetical protein
MSGYMQFRFVNEIGVNTINFGCRFPQVYVFAFMTVITILITDGRSSQDFVILP